MNSIFQNSVFAGTVLSLVAYFIGIKVRARLKFGLFNPLLIAILISIALLILTRVDYTSYNASASFLSYFLTPATICLAVPLYEQLELLKQNLKAVILGLLAGVLTSLTTIFALSVLFGLSHEDYVTLLPKSITTAIGISLSQEMGGYESITVAAIIITGILGNIFGEALCKIFKIEEPISKGLALGCSSHAIGTSKAVEMGQIEGAMGGLAIAVSGIFTVILAPIFMRFL